jgi:hypothetical protein
MGVNGGTALPEPSHRTGACLLAQQRVGHVMPHLAHVPFPRNPKWNDITANSTTGSGNGPTFEMPPAGSGRHPENLPDYWECFEFACECEVPLNRYMAYPSYVFFSIIHIYYPSKTAPSECKQNAKSKNQNPNSHQFKTTATTPFHEPLMIPRDSGVKATAT